MGSESNGVYKSVVDEFHRLMSDPFSLTDKEDFSLAGELPDVSLGGVTYRANKISAFSSRLGGVLQDPQKTANLTVDQKLDLELARDWSEASYLEDMAAVDGAPRHTVKPDSIKALADQITVVLDRDPRDKGTVIDDIIKRLDGLGEYLADGFERIERPVGVWTKLEMDAGKGFGDAVKGIRLFAEEAGYRNMAKMETALERARGHVNIYLAGLGAMPTRTELSIGPEATEQLFRSKGILLPPREIHSLAMEHIAELKDEIEALRVDIVKKYGFDSGLSIQDVAKLLKERFPSPAGKVVEFARELSNRSEQFAYENGLIKRIDNSSTEIRSTPSYLQPGIPIAAVYTPGAFCKGVRKSVFFITEFDGVERDLNQLNTPSVTAHELVPGHHYQHARAAENSSLVRAWIRPMDLAEGWTTRVAEQEMTARGFMGNPELFLEEIYMSKVDELRLSARVCFVLACLTGDRSYFANNLGVAVTKSDIIDASTELYRGITGFGEKRGRRDVELFSSIGTYGALYLVGNVLMHDMENRAKQKQGGRFNLPNFWEAILQEGNMPLSYINRALQYKGVL